MAGVPISLTGTAAASARTDGGGYFSFRNLRDAGVYRITPARRGPTINFKTYYPNPGWRDFSGLERDETANLSYSLASPWISPDATPTPTPTPVATPTPTPPPTQGGWRSALDAQKFSSLVGSAAIVVKENADAYLLSHRLANSDAATEPGELLAATLTLDRTSLRAIAQTLVVRGTSGERGHRLSEISFEQLPEKSVLPEVFRTDSELLGADVRRIETPAAPDAITGSAAAQPNAINPGALEIEARYLLDRRKLPRATKSRCSSTTFQPTLKAIGAPRLTCN